MSLDELNGYYPASTVSYEFPTNNLLPDSSSGNAYPALEDWGNLDELVELSRKMLDDYNIGDHIKVEW